jgi:integrase
MDLVRITGGTLRDKDPIILTPEQFDRLLQYIITERHRTMVIVAICLGLRQFELAGLKWSDFDWLNQRDYIVPAGESCGLERVGWHTFRHLSHLDGQQWDAAWGPKGLDASR